MENASKMLIMATTIIISVMLFSVFIYLFKAGGSMNATLESREEIRQLELYNSKFEVYCKPKITDKTPEADAGNGVNEVVTIMDIISLVNLAYDVNETSTDKNSSNYNEEYAVEIEVEISGQTYILPNTKGKVKRNEILQPGGGVISIYELLDKDISGDKLSVTKYENGDNKTIYKYIFDCKITEYNEKSGRVAKMECEMYTNPRYLDI